MVRKKYQVELHYGYQETDCGIFHSFVATDPEKPADVTEMGKTLAESLDTTVEDSDFNFNSMYISLPDSVVARIKEDAIKEFLEREAKA